jgi:hypothetical protein
MFTRHTRYRRDMAGTEGSNPSGPLFFSYSLISYYPSPKLRQYPNQASSFTVAAITLGRCNASKSIL